MAENSLIGAEPKPKPKLQFLFHKGWGCGLAVSNRRIMHVFQEIEGLTEFQKQTIINRYIGLTETLYTRTFYYAWIFHIGRTIVTVGSLTVPAILSIQNSGSLAIWLYWFAWALSLLVTTCNGILTLFKVDKKYYFLHTTLEQLESEAWQYIHLSGKYGGFYTPGTRPDHKNQYVFFCHNMEKIKLKQVEEEYYKLVETHSSDRGVGHAIVDISGAAAAGTTAHHDSRMIAGLYTPTPTQAQLLTAQQQLANALSPRQVDGGSKPTAAVQTDQSQSDQQNTPKTKRGSGQKVAPTPEMPM